MRLINNWIKGVFIVWSVIATVIAIVAVVQYCTESGFEFGTPRNISYYEIKDLRSLKLPVWTPTNNLPLAPEIAIKSALTDVQGKYPGIFGWRVNRLELERQYDEVWVYNISLVQGDDVVRNHKVVRVLMNGEVWQPKHKSN
jgi:hypothetical protein